MNQKQRNRCEMCGCEDKSNDFIEIECPCHCHDDTIEAMAFTMLLEGKLEI